MVATFDYKGFAKDLTKEAEKSIPEDIALKHKFWIKFIILLLLQEKHFLMTIQLKVPILQKL